MPTRLQAEKTSAEISTLQAPQNAICETLFFKNLGKFSP